MKPAPPVIIMFFNSGLGSNSVVPLRTGASFQTPVSVCMLRCPFTGARTALV